MGMLQSVFLSTQNATEYAVHSASALHAQTIQKRVLEAVAGSAKRKVGCNCESKHLSRSFDELIQIHSN